MENREQHVLRAWGAACRSISLYVRDLELYDGELQSLQARVDDLLDPFEAKREELQEMREAAVRALEDFLVELHAEEELQPPLDLESCGVLFAVPADVREFITYLLENRTPTRGDADAMADDLLPPVPDELDEFSVTEVSLVSNTGLTRGAPSSSAAWARTSGDIPHVLAGYLRLEAARRLEQLHEEREETKAPVSAAHARQETQESLVDVKRRLEALTDVLQQQKAELSIMMAQRDALHLQVEQLNKQLAELPPC